MVPEAPWIETNRLVKLAASWIELANSRTTIAANSGIKIRQKDMDIWSSEKFQFTEIGIFPHLKIYCSK